jgi:hypothetical protein
MFYDATVFNQNLSEWDVSKGEIFVSDQALQLFNLLFSVMTVFPSRHAESLFRNKCSH